MLEVTAKAAARPSTLLNVFAYILTPIYSSEDKR